MMARFCGQCGAPLPEGARVCGRCGTPVTAEGFPVTERFEYQSPETAARTKKIVTLVIIIALVVVLLTGAAMIVPSFVGYRGAVRKLVKAYKNYDLPTLSSMISEVTYTSYADPYIESYVSGDLDRFEDQLGSDYKLSYQIKDAYQLSDRKYTQLVDSYDAEDIISKIQVVEVELVAKRGKRTVKLTKTLYLSKESDGWKLFSIEY